MPNLTLRIHPERTLPIKAADFEGEYLNKLYLTKTTKERLFTVENSGQNRKMYDITFTFPQYHLREDPTQDWFALRPLDRGKRRLGIDEAVIKAALHNGPWEKPRPGNVYFKSINDVARCKIESLERQPDHLRVFPTLVCPVDSKASDLLGGKSCNCVDFPNGKCSLHKNAQYGDCEVGKMFPKLASQNNFMAGSNGKEGEDCKLRKRKKKVITRRDDSGNISVTVTMEEGTQTPFRLPKIMEENKSHSTSKFPPEVTSESLDSLNTSIDCILKDSDVENDRSSFDKAPSELESGAYNTIETSKGDELTALKTILRSPASARPVNSKSDQEKRVSFASEETLRQFREVSPLPERRARMKSNEKKAKGKRKRRRANFKEGQRNREMVSKLVSKGKENAPQGAKDNIDKVQHHEDSFLEKVITERKTAVSEFAPASDCEEETVLMLDPEGNLVERKLASGSKSHVTIAELRWHVQQDYVCEKCREKKKCGNCGVRKDSVEGESQASPSRRKYITRQKQQTHGEKTEGSGNLETAEGIADLTNQRQDLECESDYACNEGDLLNSTNPFVTKCVAWNETTEHDESEKVVAETGPLPESQSEEALTELMNAMRNCRYIRWPKQYRDLLEKMEEQDEKLF